MRKIYVITCTMAANKNFEFTIGDIEFAFTSKKKADAQMDVLKIMVERGDLWMGVDSTKLKGKVLSDERGDYGRGARYQRDILIESPNGIREVYRLCEILVNSGCGI